VREPWRIALALADAALDGETPVERLALFRTIPPERIAAVRRMLAGGVATTMASGMGRYFDAFGALGLARAHARYEGQVALEWNLAADPGVRASYRYDLDFANDLWTVDLRPATRQAVGDLVQGKPAAFVSASFHNTVCDATAALVEHVVRETGELPIVLTGGCFQNARLAEGVLARVSSAGTVFTHHVIPPGDGGVSLGQAFVAAARDREGS
jgi:hydrogenase maturation protein HypF